MNGQVIFNNGTLPIQRLIRKYQESFTSPRAKEVAAIHVDEIASKVAYIYERVRKIIDWKEENLLRRSAIERILKRSLISGISKFNLIFKPDVSDIAEPLIRELIRGGHLPNDEIPEEKVAEVQKVLDKYIYFLKNASFPQKNSFVVKQKVNFYEWILEIAACEIEEVLAPPEKENALIETMTVQMNERIRIIPEDKISQEDKIIQTYIATHRTLFDLDDSIIAYHLLKYRFPQWTAPSQTFIDETTKNIFSIWEAVEKDLTRPLGREFFNICERTDTAFVLLDDVLTAFGQEPSSIPEVLANRETLGQFLTQFYYKRLASLKTRLFRLAIFSTLSVFVSNWFTFFIIEIPLAHLFYEGFNLFAAAVDFVVPSLAMFVLVAIIKPPQAGNLKEVIRLTFSFIYPGEQKDIYEIKLKKKRRPVTGFIIALLYIIACFASFGAVAWVFYKAKIPITSVIFDTLMIAINIFAALAIRNKSKELTVEEKTSFWEFGVDILTLPVAKVGSWFARKWKEYNVVAVFFNVAVEMPFVTVIKFIEDWRNFLKDKKAEIH